MSTEQIIAIVTGVLLPLLGLAVKFFYDRGYKRGAAITADEVRARDELARLKEEDPTADIAARKAEIDDELSKKWEHEGESAEEVLRRIRRLHRITR